MSVRLKLNPVADFELKHFRMRMHLVKEAQALDDTMVEVNQLCFGKSVDIDFHRMPWRGE